MHRTTDFDYMVVAPAGAPDPGLPIAGSRAGAIGVLDLGGTIDVAAAASAVARLAGLGRNRVGVLVGDGDLLPTLLTTSTRPVDVVVLSAAAVADGVRAGDLEELVAAGHRVGASTFAVVTSEAQAVAAEAAGADALVAKGHEAGGWVGEEAAFVLLQRLVARVGIPVWVHGGVGLHTVAACRTAGAAGAVLDGQLLLLRESPLPEAVRAQVASMDGSETQCLGTTLGAQVRIFSRPGVRAVAELSTLETKLARADPARRGRTWRTAVRSRLDWRGADGTVLAAGQDACFAADLARRFTTVAEVLAGLDAAIVDHVTEAMRAHVLAEGSPWAAAHGTRYPIVQGPMTRVSDRAEFALSVAEAGGLPFLALALMRAPEVEPLLQETSALLGDRPWGVGILGFVPAELRAEQLGVLLRFPPSVALIAGGRPDQAAALEAKGIPTYLHVPSPGLLGLYLREGARRFVFEGRECGGHVGPRTSFVLWDTMVRSLLERLPPVTPAAADPAPYDVLFAGGIHDGRSAAMVASMAAPLAGRGVRVGVLLGTAYLFTQEAVDAGAITPGFQEAAVSCTGTVLLESGPGHATRCLPSPFVDDFREKKLALTESSVSSDDLRNRLEVLNIGRLRVAAKGVDRNPGFGVEADAPKLLAVDGSEQWRRGMYMIGQAAALRDRVVTIAELHHDVSAGASEHLAAVALPPPVDDDVAAETALGPADIAIVGIGCILPGAADAATFWSNVVGKHDAVGEVPATRWDWRDYFDPDPSARDKVYSRWGGFIDDVEFDPLTFGMPPASLRSIEPFQLLGLLVARAALDDAGFSTRSFPRIRTSVILGAGGGGADLGVGYTVRATLPKLFGASASEVTDALAHQLPEWTEDSFAGVLMNVAAGRIANRLDLGGLNFTVDAACASSLAAICLAVRELQSGVSDMAIVGGVDAIQNPFSYLCFAKTQALSPTGRCRPFDASADGIAISEGFAAVVLKRRPDAERDGDRIYALIRGVGGASDGRDRSLTAPRPEGQIRALRRAYAHAGCGPQTVGMIEAHGTGTVAGDGAEVSALSTVFSAAGADRQACALGSVKSMIGHTKATAGVAGLIKAALALHHRVLPPTLGVTTPNPKARFPDSPFYVNSETRPWVHGTAGGEPRRAGVSAFGFGGTNFHVVLEEYTGAFLDDAPAPVASWPAELLVWRGRSRADVAATAASVSAALDGGARPSLTDLANTLAMQARQASDATAVLAVVAESLDDLRSKLRGVAQVLAGDASRHHGTDGVHYGEQPMAAGDGKVAFLFPGQGSQRVDMIRDLAVAFTDVRTCFDHADDVLAGRLPQRLSRYLFPPPTFTADDAAHRQAELTETHIAQPALAAANLACLRLLGSLGVHPDMVGGHSFGEIVALGAAGAITDDDVVRLAEARGRFIREEASAAGGAMIAVDEAPEALQPLVADGELVFANMNAPRQTVLAGSRAAVGQALEWCRSHELRARVLPVACAFHSPHVAAAQRRLSELLTTTAITVPHVPVFSNTTAAPYPESPHAIAGQLCEHLVRPVQFVAEVDAMYDAGARLFVEVGPGSVLTGLTTRILADRPHLCTPVDQRGRHGVTQLLQCLAALASEGVAVDLEALFRGRAARVLELATLERSGGKPEATGAGATMWLVNGGRARPAADVAGDEVPHPVRVEVAGDGASHPVATNGTRAPSGPTAPITAPAPPPSAAPTVATPLNGVGNGVERVLGQWHRTMRHFLDTQQSVLLSYMGGRAAPPADVARTNGRAPIAAAPPVAGATDRFLLCAVPAPALAGGVATAGGVFVIVDDGKGVGQALAGLLRRRGDQTVRVSPETGRPCGPDEIAVRLDDEAAVATLAARVVTAYGRIRGLVVLSPLGHDGAKGLGRSSVPRELVGLFLLARALGPELLAAAADGGSVVLGATGMGGAFAVDGPVPGSAVGQGTVHGFLKTLAQEWPAVRVKAVDLPEVAPDAAAGWLLAELSAVDGLVEVGYRQGSRVLLQPTPMPVDGRAEAGDVLDSRSVVLLTGGARGITGEVAVALAERYRPTLVIVGRTALVEEHPATAGLTEMRALKQAIAERRRVAGAAVTPGAVEADHRALLAGREVADTLSRLRHAGATVDYITCDVRDGSFADVVDQVYARHRRIDGVIHGAGVLEDKLVADKRLDSFERVVATKLAGAATLARKLRPESLRFMVLFSSVSGRFGNRGQADYAAASEGLNKLAQELDRRWPARVVSINWGPWLTKGMVSPEVLRQFESRGVALIPVEEGCRRLDEELRFGRKGEVEVTIAGGRVPGASGGSAPAKRPPTTANGADPGNGNGHASPPARWALLPMGVEHRRDGGVDVLRTLDPAVDRYLDDHRIDGRPVLPFAMAMELMAETAAAGWPSLHLTGLSDVRLLRGVTVDDGGYRVRVTAVPRSAQEPDGARRVDVVVASVDAPNLEHYRATVELGGPVDDHGGDQAADLFVPDLAPFTMTVADAYESFLFHGPTFQGIQAITGMGPGGARAMIKPSDPAACVAGAGNAQWLVDPVVVDCALQVQLIWARLQWDLTVLPTRLGHYRRLSPLGPGASVAVKIRSRSETRRPLSHADHRFYGSDGLLLGSLTDMASAGSPSLNRLAAGRGR